jgi:hypothetical protein
MWGEIFIDKMCQHTEASRAAHGASKTPAEGGAGDRGAVHAPGLPRGRPHALDVGAPGATVRGIARRSARRRTR